MSVHSHGFWQGTGIVGDHAFDPTLCDTLTEFFKGEKVESLVDLGCGLGDYVKHFKKEGLNVVGYDGNPNTPELTNYRCGVLDLSQTVRFDEKFDWVMSLEVAEHIPAQFEETYIQNLHNNNKRGILLSWAKKGQGGLGHVNEQDNEYVKNLFATMGYLNDVDAERKLRESASKWWFTNTIMVFRKV
jgi:cyclopropane fatty-acyl-phospholipid synthase-like methyltransferase